jgi:hypothetical protein
VDIDGRPVFGTESLSSANIVQVGGASLHLRVVVRPIGEQERLHVRLKRREYRQCPGTYNLVQPELTDGIKVFLDDCPDDIRVELIVRPFQQQPFILDTDSTSMYASDEVLLPGHCIEFKLVSRGNAANTNR